MYSYAFLFRIDFWTKTFYSLFVRTRFAHSHDTRGYRVANIERPKHFWFTVHVLRNTIRLYIQSCTYINFISSGDVNVNQNLGIALIQNLFLRFHNHIADKLQDDHPTWTDETVYQETRRIVAAVIQIITYDRYLPIILGERDE